MDKQWNVQDEVYTMIWYYEDNMKVLKTEKHDLIIEINKLKKMLNDYPSLETETKEKESKLKDVILQINITKSLLRRLKKVSELYDITY